MKTLVMIVVAIPFAVFANVWTGEKTANTVYTMADYSAAGNWQENAAPSGAAAVADLSTMTADGVFVRIPQSLIRRQRKRTTLSTQPSKRRALQA